MVLVSTVPTGPTAHAGVADEVARIDRSIVALAAAPDSVGRLGQLRALIAAQSRLAQRQAIVAEHGSSAEPPLSAERLVERVASACAGLRIRVETRGPAAGLAEAIVAGLVSLGYRPVVTAKPDETPDLIVHAVSEIDDAQQDGRLHRVRATVAFDIEEGARARIVARFKEIFTYGAAEAPAARQRAVDKLAERVRKKAINRVDRIIKGQRANENP